jgi:GAF domain-containing protein
LEWKMSANSSIPAQNQEAPTAVLPTSQTLRYALAGAVFGCAFPILATAISVFSANLPWNPANVAAVQGSDPLLWIIDTAPFFLGLLTAFAGRRQDALSEANAHLQLREQDLTTLKSNLELGVEERTHELEQRSALMASLLSVTSRISGSPEVAGILAIVVDQVPQYFGGLATEVFLLDQTAGTLVLRATSSDAEKARLSQGYAVEIGGPGLVSRAAAEGRIETDEKGRQPGGIPEIAFPLSTRGHVIGVLDVKSPERPLRQHESDVLRLLADHVAAAIESARLLEESRSSIAQLQNALREQADISWQEYLTHQKMALQYTRAGVRSVADVAAPEPEEGLRTPLALRGWEIGSIALRRQAAPQWTEEERDLVQKVALQVALAVDNNRLLNETRRRALHEQTVSELSARFNETVEIDSLLRIAVREFASLPEVNEATVAIRGSAATSTQAGQPPTRLSGYKYNNIRMEPVSSVGQAGINAMDRGAAIISDPAGTQAGQGQLAAIPIVFRGQVLGVVVVMFQRPRAPEGAIVMITQAADRLATAFENARLLQDSLRRADQERLVAEITSKIGSSISMRNVLQTAVEELGRAIAGSEVTIRLRPEGAAQPKESLP